MRNQIVIETSDLDRARADLVAIVRAHGGALLRTQPVPSGLELTLTLAQRDEQGLLLGLKGLGRVSIPTAGYKDSEGHLVVMLRQAGEQIGM